MRHLILTLALMLATPASFAADLIDFWNTPRHGGNSFNRLPPDQAYFDALRGYGATWVRLSYDKWHAGGRDFLLGDADHYSGLVEADLHLLRQVLDRAHRAGLKVVIAPLSLPGSRWSQNNQGRFDDRLWQDKHYWTQAARFWQDLAKTLKDHPAIAAYNLINEPFPEKHSDLAEHATAQSMKQWYAREQGGPRDLPAFSAALIEAIREVDENTPVMVDAGWFAAADSFSYWPSALADTRVLYSVHMYEPFAATNAPNVTRQRAYDYPGTAPFADGYETWNAKRVADYLRLPVQWADAMQVPRSRLVVGEFGCMRRLAGCRQYLEDVLTALDEQRLHWAFYSFREDSWDGMDYELGSQKVSWQYWQAIEDGTADPVIRSATEEFEPIRRRLQP